MVDREKVVVILLIVTIILAVISMIVTFSASPVKASDSGSNAPAIKPATSDESSGSATFSVLPTNANSGGTK